MGQSQAWQWRLEIMLAVMELNYESKPELLLDQEQSDRSKSGDFFVVDNPSHCWYPVIVQSLNADMHSQK